MKFRTCISRKTRSGFVIGKIYKGVDIWEEFEFKINSEQYGLKKHVYCTITKKHSYSFRIVGDTVCLPIYFLLK
jgi:hypothetical protein